MMKDVKKMITVKNNKFVFNSPCDKRCEISPAPRFLLIVISFSLCVRARTSFYSSFSFSLLFSGEDPFGGRQGTFFILIPFFGRAAVVEFVVVSGSLFYENYLRMCIEDLG